MSHAKTDKAEDQPGRQRCKAASELASAGEEAGGGDCTGNGGERMRELLFSVTKKDFVIQTFRSGGPGGQNQNKVNSGVRIIHKESGARGESRESRSQLENKKTALKRLAETKEFKIWHKKKVAECLLGKDHIEKQVDEMMQSKNLRIEVFASDRWIIQEMGVKTG